MFGKAFCAGDTEFSSRVGGKGIFRAAQARPPHPGKKEDHPQGGPPFHAFCRRAAGLTPS